MSIAIVGGGPAGVSTWLHLHALAPDIARDAFVIDAERFPRDKPCGGGVTPLGAALLGGIGLDMGPDAVEIDQVEVRSGGGQQCIPLSTAMHVVNRRSFDAHLVATAVDRGMRLVENDPCLEVAVDGDHARVVTQAGEYRVDAVVGADGAYSRVRNALGTHAGRRARLVKTVMGDAGESEHRRRLVFDFAPVDDGIQGYTWRFPCVEEGVAAMNVGVFDSGFHPDEGRPDLLAALRGAMEESDAWNGESAWIGHPVRWFEPGATLAAPRVFVVGDAAGVDPALGEGISLALDYGDLAANVLIDAHRRNDFSFADFNQRLLDHAVGQSLTFRHQMAQQMYRRGRKRGAAAAMLIRRWLAG